MNLAVWMYGRKTATLGYDRRAISFAYTAEALSKFGLGRPLISVSMPTRNTRYRGNVPTFFFDGLLPEGDARETIAYDLGVEANDVLEMLGALGRDCAGALVVLPEGEQPEQARLPEPIGDAEIERRLQRLGIEPLGTDGKVRASLAGMQRKLLLSRAREGWGLPVDGAPSTHIVKPPHHDTRFPEMIANEALCLRTAHLLGVAAAHAFVRSFGSTPALVVERYDRTKPSEGEPVLRLHQEDMCQAAGVDGARLRKYEEGGGPSLVRCAEIIKAWSRDPQEQMMRLLDITAINMIVGNGDAHGKNISLLHDEAGRVELAPAYDIFSSLWYDAASTTPGMYVNGIRELTDIKPEDLIAEATRWGLSTERVTARVRELITNAADALAAAAAETQPPDELITFLTSRARALQF